jgi:hypothetical protein
MDFSIKKKKRITNISLEQCNTYNECMAKWYARMSGRTKKSEISNEKLD